MKKSSTEKDNLDLTDESGVRNDESSSSDSGAASETGGDAVAETDSARTDSAEIDPFAAMARERDEYHDKWLRAVADLENYRKRVQRDAEEQRRYQAIPFARDLLPALDNLDRAIEAAKQSEQVGDLIEGLQLVSTQFRQILAGWNVEPIAAVGQPFDPNQHEAVQQVPSNEEPAMTVVMEVETGYMLGDRVVRPSKVIVSSGPPKETNEN